MSRLNETGTPMPGLRRGSATAAGANVIQPPISAPNSRNRICGFDLIGSQVYRRRSPTGSTARAWKCFAQYSPPPEAILSSASVRLQIDVLLEQHLFDRHLALQQQRALVGAAEVEFDLVRHRRGEPGAAHHSRLPALQFQFRDVLIEPHDIIDMGLSHGRSVRVAKVRVERLSLSLLNPLSRHYRMRPVTHGPNFKQFDSRMATKISTKFTQIYLRKM